MDDYRALLAEIDAWYRDARARFPAELPCEKGCRTCCLGAFDVSLADAALLREGLAAAEPAVREDIVRRSRELLARLRAVHPRLGSDLDGWDADEVDDLCDEEPEAECPVLGPDGSCRLYAHRPLVCRMSGLPAVDVTGEVVFPDGCANCTLPADRAPRLDFHRLRRRERKILERLVPGRSGVTLLIAQALEA